MCSIAVSNPADRREHIRRPPISTHRDDWDELEDGVAKTLSAETQRRFAECNLQVWRVGDAERIEAVRLASEDERALLIRTGCVDPDTLLFTICGIGMCADCIELLGLEPSA